jgi:uncharacterized protein with LGFP repeats
MRSAAAGARRRAVVVVALLAPLAVVLTLLTSGTAPAQASTGADFRAGNIISDSVFFNANTMSAANIQGFLEAKVPTCKGGTCLRDYYQDTWTRAADAQCAAYEGRPRERASTIIYKVAQSCGINPMVLLVLLQKESSLVTSTAPTARSYQAATGYACPDTAPCNAEFEGFYNQVYKAAWQYKRYTNNPTSYSYRAGRSQYIGWNPNGGCGGSNVYIENRATAALYIYTPYQPNAAALNNLYGTGDSCSAYGNRNFWRIFTDWFGSTQASYSVVGPISVAYDANGGGSGALGDAVGEQYRGVGGGLVQPFQFGRIHYSAATGAHAVIGPLSAAYDSTGGEGGPLGYPTAGRYPTANNGWTQPFANGRIHWTSATGARAVIGPIAALYDSAGGEGGVLGYPTGGRYVTPNGGFTQPFQNGRIHWSPATGAHAVRGVFTPVYNGMLGESGALGYPVSEQYATAGGGLTQAFQNGRIHWSQATGAHAVIGPMSTAYDALSGEGGVLGYPTGGRYSTPGNGYTQPFKNGRIHWSPTTGAHAVIGPLSAAYDARGGESGALGYPTGDRYATTSGGVGQAFANGSLVISSSGTVRSVEGAIGASYAALGGGAGTLGEPTAAPVSTGGGTTQGFQGGRVLDGPATPAVSVRGPVLAAFDAAGGPAGALGWPAAEQTTSAKGTVSQRFASGWVVLTSGGTRTVLGDVATRWTALGGIGGTLGEPTANRTTLASGGYAQTFTGGQVVTTSTGTRAVLAEIATAYTLAGGPVGSLGVPTSERYATPGSGWTQVFANGRIHFSPATGAHAVLSPLSPAYDALIGESGPLGYPVAGRVAAPGGGWTQSFEKGRIAWSAATGARAVIAPIAPAYAALQGESGPLGYPTSAAYPTRDNGSTQAFQNGRIHRSPATGAHAVIGPMSVAYDAMQGESGALGYPTSDRYPTAGNGFTQAFQNGRIHWSPATGARAVLSPISPVYDSVFGESGALGYPVSDRYPTAGNGWTQAFQNGRIHWSPATGGFAVLRPLSPVYDALIGESGRLGYPTSWAYPTRDSGLTQAFRTGRIHYSPATGAHAVIGDLSRAYDGRGGESGPLGYPTTDERVSGNVRTQGFQHGTITQTGTGTPVVTVR